MSYPKQSRGHFETWYCIGGFIYINVLTHSFYLDGSGTVPDGQAGAEGFDCPDDFIVVSGIRLCGYKINDGKLNLDYSQSTPVTGFRLQYTLQLFQSFLLPIIIFWFFFVLFGQSLVGSWKYFPRNLLKNRGLGSNGISRFIFLIWTH